MANKKITLDTLSLQARFVSIESVDQLTTSGLAMSKLAELVVDTGQYIKEKFNSVMAYFSEVKDFKEIDRFTEKFKYLDAKNFVIIVPEGFQGNLKNYVELLVEINTKFSTKFYKEVLAPYDEYISRIVNQPNLLESLSYKHSVKLKDIETYRKELGKFIGKRYDCEARLQDVCDNMNDLKNAKRLTLELMSLLQQTHIVEIKKNILTLSTKINLLAETLNSNTANINVKSDVAKTLSDLTMELAKHTEFFAVVDAMSNSLIGSMVTTNEVLKDVR